MVAQDEDISPYATFHLLGMREENKNGMMNPQAYKTMPHPPQQGGGPMPGGPPQAGHQTGPNTPAHQRQMAQTMNVNITKISLKLDFEKLAGIQIV